jgi:hypothetical protein
VFVVDVSGSMSTCIDALRKNIEAFIDSLSRGDGSNVARGQAAPLLGSLPLPARNAEVSAALHRCLSPDPAVGTMPARSCVIAGKARKKMPNRFSRGSQFGHEDFADFCALSAGRTRC